MNDCKLSDFSTDQLTILLRILSKEKKDLSSHVDSIRSYGPHLENLLKDNVLEYETDIEEINIITAQVLSALVKQTDEIKVKMN